MNLSGAGTRRLCTAMVLLAVWAATAVPAAASNEALLRLLQVLRDRGSITAAEYEEIRKVASMPEPAAPDARVAVVEQRVAAQEKALSSKWYEKIGLRGYAQVRFSNVTSDKGVPVEVPNDRSVNAPETMSGSTRPEPGGSDSGSRRCHLGGSTCNPARIVRPSSARMRSTARSRANATSAPR